MGEQRILLEDIPDATLACGKIDERFSRNVLKERRIVERDRSAIWRGKTGDRLKRLRFPGAGRTKEHQNFRVDSEVHLQGDIPQAFDEVNV